MGQGAAPKVETAAKAELAIPLRYPGQYKDGEANIAYNYFRTYDASVGRYTQADPIGLRGGINRYNYVGGNPMGAVDPFGLLEWTGTMEAASAAYYIGAGWYEFELSSEYDINGRQATIKIHALGPVLGLGLRATATRTGISFEDHLEEANPSTFNGLFGFAGAGFQVGPLGTSISKIRLGDAFSRETFDTVGVDASVGIGFGSSTVTDVSWLNCECQQ